DAALDNDDPYAGVTVFGPGADADNLGLGKLVKCGPGKSLLGGHVSIVPSVLSASRCDSIQINDQRSGPASGGVPQASSPRPRTSATRDGSPTRACRRTSGC